jgi:DNA-binding MarR family transcriptional regulator
MLMEINNNPDMNTTMLAEHLGITKGAVSQVIKKLKEKGLIIKEKNSTENFAFNITHSGKSAIKNHEESHKLLMTELKDFWDTLDKDQQQKFFEILSKLERKAMEV